MSVKFNPVLDVRKREIDKMFLLRHPQESISYLCDKGQRVKDPAEPSRWQDFQNRALPYSWAFAQEKRLSFFLSFNDLDPLVRRPD